MLRVRGNHAPVCDDRRLCSPRNFNGMVPAVSQSMAWWCVIAIRLLCGNACNIVRQHQRDGQDDKPLGHFKSSKLILLVHHNQMKLNYLGWAFVAHNALLWFVKLPTDRLSFGPNEKITIFALQHHTPHNHPSDRSIHQINLFCYV